MSRRSKLDELIAAFNELLARFEAEATERRAWVEICTKHPQRLGNVEASLLELQLRLGRISDDVDRLKKGRRP